MNSKSVSDGYILSSRLYSFEETPNEKQSTNNIPSPIQEQDAFDPSEYWEAINDRDKRIEALCGQNELIISEKEVEIQKNQALQQEILLLKQKMGEIEVENIESCHKYERKILNLEGKLLEISEKLDRTAKLISIFEENSRSLENMVSNCKNDCGISEETIDFQSNLEKNFEEMQSIEAANANVYKETLDLLKKCYQEKIEDMRACYEERLKNQENPQENKEKTEKMEAVCCHFSLIEEKAKILGYTGIDEALEQNKLLWEEIKSLRKTQETYKNENEQLHHELDSFAEKLEKKEDDFKALLLERHNAFQKQIEEKERLFQGEKDDLEGKIQVLTGQIEENKEKMALTEGKYDEIERKNKRLNQKIATFIARKGSQLQKIKDITVKTKRFKKELEEIKKIPVKINEILAFFQSKHYKNSKNDPELQKSPLDLSRNLTTHESETGVDAKNLNVLEKKALNGLEVKKFNVSANFEKRSMNFNEKTKTSARTVVGEVHDFSEYIQNNKEGPLNEELKDLRENLSEHLKIAEILSENLKGEQLKNNKSKNELVLFNYFEKLFDRLSLSLQKENEIKSMIQLLDEKMERNMREKTEKEASNYKNVREEGSKTLEIEILRAKNMKLEEKQEKIDQELEEKQRTIIQLEGERNEYRKTCKELQIQLDFKRVQDTFAREKVHDIVAREKLHDREKAQQDKATIEKNKNYQEKAHDNKITGENNEQYKHSMDSQHESHQYETKKMDVAEIYQKYLKSKPMNRQTEGPIKSTNIAPRTPNGKDVNKTVARIIQDHQKTKNGKLNSSKDSQNGNYY